MDCGKIIVIHLCSTHTNVLIVYVVVATNSTHTKVLLAHTNSIYSYVVVATVGVATNSTCVPHEVLAEATSEG